MISPEEIRTVTFERQNMGGYRRSDVDSFLQQVADDAAEMQRKIEDSDKKLLILAQKIEEYRKDEDNVKTALLNAQRMAENIVREARQKSDAMLREAGIKADDIVRSAKDRVEEESGELERVQAEVAKFKASVLQLYKQHIESLSTLPGEEEHANTEETAEEPIPATEEAVHTPEEIPASEPEASAPATEEASTETEATEGLFDSSASETEDADDQQKDDFFSSFQGIRFSD